MNEHESIALDEVQATDTEVLGPAEQKIEANDGLIEEDNTEASDEVSALKAEIDKLRMQLEERELLDRVNKRMNAELAQFEEYFPDVAMEDIPQEVWEKVRAGASLSAQYSLYQRRKELEKRKIGEVNGQNRKMSTGAISHGDGEKYYSPSEVRRMSPAQVKKHYDEIVESMRHWN